MIVTGISILVFCVTYCLCVFFLLFSCSEELRKEARQLKRELNAAKKKREDEEKETQRANEAKEGIYY